MSPRNFWTNVALNKEVVTNRETISMIEYDKCNCKGAFAVDNRHDNTVSMAEKSWPH